MSRTRSTALEWLVIQVLWGGGGAFEDTLAETMVLKLIFVTQEFQMISYMFG